MTKKGCLEQALGDYYAEITYFPFDNRLFVSLKKKKIVTNKTQVPNQYQCCVNFAFFHPYSFIPHRLPGRLSYLVSKANRLPLIISSSYLNTCFTCSVCYMLIDKAWEASFHSHCNFFASYTALAFSLSADESESC